MIIKAPVESPSIKRLSIHKPNRIGKLYFTRSASIRAKTSMSQYIKVKNSWSNPFIRIDFLNCQIKRRQMLLLLKLH